MNTQSDGINAVGLSLFLVLTGGTTPNQGGAEMLHTNSLLPDQEPMGSSTARIDDTSNRAGAGPDLAFPGRTPDDMTDADDLDLLAGERLNWRQFAASLFPGARDLTKEESAAYRRIRERAFGID